jgi:hypothetical protein
MFTNRRVVGVAFVTSSNQTAVRADASRGLSGSDINFDHDFGTSTVT